MYEEIKEDVNPVIQATDFQLSQNFLFLKKSFIILLEDEFGINYLKEDLFEIVKRVIMPLALDVLTFIENFIYF